MRAFFLKFILMVAALFLTPAAFAQSIFDFGSKDNSTTNQPQTKVKVQVMSPNEFKSDVQKLGQQVNNGLSEQAKQQFIKSPPVPPMNLSAPLPDNRNDNSSSPPSSVPSPIQPVQPAQPQTPAPAVKQPVSPNYPPPPPAYNQPPVTTSPQPVQNQAPYSGFGPGNTAPSQGGGSNSQGTSGGGWNIKY